MFYWFRDTIASYTGLLLRCLLFTMLATRAAQLSNLQQEAFEMGRYQNRNIIAMYIVPLYSVNQR